MTDADQDTRGAAVVTAYFQHAVDQARAERDAAQAKLDAAEADAAAFTETGELPAGEQNPRIGDGIMLINWTSGRAIRCGIDDPEGFRQATDDHNAVLAWMAARGYTAPEAFRQGGAASSRRRAT